MTKLVRLLGRIGTGTASSPSPLPENCGNKYRKNKFLLEKKEDYGINQSALVYKVENKYHETIVLYVKDIPI